MRLTHVLPLGEPYSPVRGGAVARVVAGTVPHLDPRIRATVISQWYPRISWYEGRRVVGFGGRLTTGFNRQPRLRSLQRRMHVGLHPLVLKSTDCFIVEGDVRLAAFLPPERTCVRFHNWVKPHEEEILRRLGLVRVLTVGQAMAERLLQHMPGLAGRLQVVGGAVDTALFRPARPGVDSPQESILYVGRIAPEKGVLELLAAFERLLHSRPSARLLVAGGTSFGRNPETDYLRRVQVAVHDVHARWPGAVTLLGPVDHHRQLPEVMRSAAVGVFPSVGDEALPLAALEAMSTGLPLVASNFGGLAEAVGDAGVLVDPTDADQLAGALHRLLQEVDEARLLGAKARQRVMRHFTWEVAGRRLSKTVLGVLEESSHPI